jgi:xylulokinase
MNYLLGLDIGTTSIKACLYDPQQGQIVDLAAQPTPVRHPRPEWSEHDPEALWTVLCDCLRRMAAAAAARGASIAALGISSLAEAGLPLDEHDRPLYPIVAWHDRRCAPQVTWWEANISLAELHAITGQRVSTSFGVNKWMWLRDSEPEVAARTRRWLSVPDYVHYRLAGGVEAGAEPVTDRSIASRTLLLDQRSLDWSPRLLSMAGLDRDLLARVCPSGAIAGHVSPQAAVETGLPVGLPCVLGGHDHLCASLAAGADRPGVVVDSTGTAAALLMVLNNFYTSEIFARQSLACYAHVAKDHYVLKGGLKAAGGSIEWLARRLSGESGSLPYAELEAAAWEGVGRRAGPVFMPHLLGAGSPESDACSRGAMVGLLAAHNNGDLFRALLESLAYWTRQNLNEMERLTGQKPDRIVLLGGVTRLKLLSQLKADAVNLPVEIPDLPEAAATGAALLAGVGAGVFSSLSEAVASVRTHSETIPPDPHQVTWYARLFDEVYAPLYETLKETNGRLEGLGISER